MVRLMYYTLVMQKITHALAQIGNLKNVDRAGWVRMGIPSPESVADHAFRTTTLALLLGPELNVDMNKLIKMALIHDLAESDPDVGDITPFDGVSLEEKSTREHAAMKKLTRILPNGEEVLTLWREYEALGSPESQLCQQIDVLEMALQAREYERQYKKDLSAFIDDARQRIHHPALLHILEEAILSP